MVLAAGTVYVRSSFVASVALVAQCNASDVVILSEPNTTNPRVDSAVSTRWVVLLDALDTGNNGTVVVFSINISGNATLSATASDRLLALNASQLLTIFNASSVVASYAVVPEGPSTVAPSSSPPADGGLTDQQLILAIVLPIAGTMLLVGVAIAVYRRYHHSGYQSSSSSSGGSFLHFTHRKEEIKFDEYMMMIDHNTTAVPVMHMEERML